MRVYWLEDCQSLLWEDCEPYLCYVSLQRRRKLVQMQSLRAKKLGLLGQLLLRERLCSLTGEENRRLKFSSGKSGKPYAKGYPQVFFNLSHSQNAVACVFSHAPVGLDIQAVGPLRASVVKHVFAPEEQRMLHAALAKERMFAGIWTRKEAYGKYLGCGATFPLLQTNTLHMQGVRLRTYANGQYALSVCAHKLPGALCVVRLGAKEFLQHAAKTLSPIPETDKGV